MPQLETLPNVGPGSVCPSCGALADYWDRGCLATPGPECPPGVPQPRASGPIAAAPAFRLYLWPGVCLRSTASRPPTDRRSGGSGGHGGLTNHSKRLAREVRNKRLHQGPRRGRPD